MWVAGESAISFMKATNTFVYKPGIKNAEGEPGFFRNPARLILIGVFKEFLKNQIPSFKSQAWICSLTSFNEAAFAFSPVVPPVYR